MTFLDNSTFATVFENAPLVAIDLVIQKSGYRYLLGRRTNEPAKGDWFVPGGRIRKNELFADALARITKTELGDELDIANFSLYGVYQHIYDDRHYLVIAVTTKVDDDWDPNVVEADCQHSEFDWWKPGRIIKSSVVHRNTKDYWEGAPVI